MKKLVASLLVLSLISCLSACSTNKENVTFEEIIEKSDRCVVVSTISLRSGRCGVLNTPSSKDSETTREDLETRREGNVYYTDVEVLWGDTEELPEYITIVQEKSNYIKEDNIYAVFINESSENENHFYVTEGKSGAIYVKGNEFTCLDKSLQKNAEEIFGTTYDDFEEWLFAEYVGERSLVSTENPV